MRLRVAAHSVTSTINPRQRRLPSISRKVPAIGNTRCRVDFGRHDSSLHYGPQRKWRTIDQHAFTHSVEAFLDLRQHEYVERYCGRATRAT